MHSSKNNLKIRLNSDKSNTGDGNGKPHKSKKIFNISQPQSLKPKDETRNNSTKSRDYRKEKLDYARHGTRCQYKQLLATEHKLLKTVAALYGNLGHELRQPAWSRKYEESELQSQV